MNEPKTSAFTLRLGDGRSIDLITGASLSGSDIPGLHSVPLGGPVAAVTQHPTDPSIQGLQNLSHLPWRVRLPNGDSVEVKPGKNVRLATGTRINFGQVEGDIQIGSEFSEGKSRAPFWITIASVVLLLGLLGLGGWYFEHRLMAEKARRERIAREEQQAREEAQKRDQERTAQLQKQQEEAAAAAQRAAQEQARLRALAEAAAATPPPSPTPAPDFYGTWVADGPAFGFVRHGDDKLTERKVTLGSWHATLIAKEHEHAIFTVEFSEHFAGFTHWFDMPAPFNETPKRYMKYTTQSVEISATNTALSILWDGWKLVEWRPSRYPRPAFESLYPAELPVQKMQFRLTGKDELTSADLVFHRR